MRYRRSSAQYISGPASTSVCALHHTLSGTLSSASVMSAPRTSLRTKHTINSKSVSPFEVSMYEHARMRRKNVMDTEERRRQLEADPWALEVLPKLVKCRGCLRWIKLDQRSMYYGGLWNKHRDHCRCIKRMKGEQIPKRESRSKGAAKIAKSSDKSTALRSTRVPRKGAKGQDTIVFGVQETFYSRDPSLNARELIRDATPPFEFLHTPRSDSLRTSCRDLSSESDDDTYLLTPQYIPSTLPEEADTHGTPKDRDVDRALLQTRRPYQGLPDYGDHMNEELEYPVSDTCVVAKERLNRQKSITDVAVDEVAHTNPEKMELDATSTASPLLAKNLANEIPSFPQIMSIGREVLAGYSITRADRVLPPLSAHLTAHSRSFDNTCVSQSEKNRHYVSDGVFAPADTICWSRSSPDAHSETPDSCPASPCYHSTTRHKLDTYFDNSTFESLAHNVTFAFGPNDLNGAHCLLSLAMSSGR